ncbi:hypothetical protein TH61_01345 [Rufibacter sp. DG15C]|uniref:hypothetical protein n=1 Tax=Rufibacter sp. DG15C TaxID=1379909 RepID=UPI00078E5FE9|nr:hypothetical protein [Rufibacter sp. DG15C]AMM50090.1 hypothetical protein TH61_01345 [Rufibacter sp. DG15C]
MQMKNLIGFCLLLALGTKAFAQTDKNGSSTASSEGATATAETKTGWWTIGLESANNASFYGRNTAIQYPYVAGSLTYTHKSGLWASAMSYQLFDTEDVIDETDLSVGYNFKLGERFDGSVSYTRFFFGKNTPLIQSVTSNAATASGNYDWQILYTGLTTSYVFGGSNDIFTVLDNSRYIALDPLWKGKFSVGLDPKVSVIAGTQDFAETHTTVTQNKKKGTVLDPIIPVGGNKGSGGTTTTTTTSVSKRFRVLNYAVRVPLVVSVGNFEFEPAYRYAVPVNKVEGDESKPQSFYSMNLSYTF